MKNKKIIQLFILTTFFALKIGSAQALGVWQNFDGLPVTPADQAPISGGGFTYSLTAAGGGQWQKNTSFINCSACHDTFNNYTFGIPGSAHMGFTTFGYPEITNEKAISGNSLRFYATGGETALNEVLGTLNYNKGAYLNLSNPDATGAVVGSPYLYFSNNQGTYDDPKYPFEQAAGSNRMMMYVWFPSGMSIGSGGTGVPPTQTFNIGPYIADTGGHWYHRFYMEKSGWKHIMMDGHPQWNNGWDSVDKWPYPSWSTRSMPDYVSNIYKFYLTTYPYGGIGAVIPYSLYVDDIEFIADTEPQNDETINSPGVGYDPSTQTFEISFNSKYSNSAYSYSTYELRYSFSPITNSNWAEATPVHVLADSRYHIADRADGKFAKWWPYYVSVWAPFTLATSGELNLLTPGNTIYFAIKDISQVDGDGQVPVTGCGVGNWNTCGRDYVNHGDAFDYIGDQPVLKLIKRIDYTMSNSESAGDEIAPPSGLNVL